MIMQVEDELSLNIDQNEGQNMMVMNVGDSGSYQTQAFAVGTKGNFFKRHLTKEERRKLRCRHCHESGHEMEECFKLHGISDWYRRLKGDKEGYPVNFADNSEETESVLGSMEQNNGVVDISKDSSSKNH